MDTRNRAILIILIVILFMSGIFVAISVYEFKQGYNEKIRYHEDALEYLVESEFQRLTQTYASRINGFIGSNTGVIKAFQNSNRDELIELLMPRFQTLRKENRDFYNISFYLPDGKLYLSMNDITRYGTDMSVHGYINALIKHTDSIHGFTISNDRLYYQVAKNIIIDGKKIGILEFMIHTTGMNDMVKQVLKAEYGLSILETLADDSMHPTIIDKSSSIYDRLPSSFNPTKTTQQITVGDTRYIIHSKEIYDFKGDLIGHYLTTNNITDLQKRFISFFIYILTITALVIILSSTVLYVGFGAVLKKIEKLNISLETKVAERTRELEEAKDNAVYQNKVISSLYKRFKSMFQDHHSIMFIISPDGNVIDANIAACRFFNMDKEELLSLKVSDVSLLPEADVYEMLQRSMYAGLQNYISKFKLSDRIYDIEIQASPIEMDGQTLLFAICHDVTEKVAMETKLKDMNKNLEKMINEETDKRHKQEQLLIQQSKMSSVGELLSAIIHQWKQPITAISYLMQDIADAAERNQLDQHYLMGIAEESLNQINYMNQTVEDFRSFLMPSKSKESFNIASDVHTVIKMLSKQLQKDNISLNLTVVNSRTEMASYSSEELIEKNAIGIETSCFRCYGYANEFKQVLMNVLNNARDAIKGEKTEVFGGIINIVISADGTNIEISIADNAGGIPEKIIDRVFEPYFTTKPSKGTGIGLYMAKSIIEDHMGGSIKAKNSDTGAIFKIVLKQS
jgi:PAS domain S-box-containing protein